MPKALYDRIPPRTPEGEPSSEDLMMAFLSYVEDLGIGLYPAQEDAILALFAGQSVVLDTPTGSGKTLVALALEFRAIATGRRCFYTAPIKALVSEKFFDACKTLGPSNVGMMTGDASINGGAPVVCCTAEILAQIALRDGEEADVDYVVMDEFHFYADRERGAAWQIPLLALPQARFLLMSATFGNPEFFAKEIESITQAEATLVQSDERPVPLHFRYSDDTIHRTLDDLLEAKQHPIYIVHFTQRSASEHAQDLMSINLLSKEEKRSIGAEISKTRFDTPFGKELRRFLGHGIGVHHAGLLPKYRLLVERLAQQGMLRIICGTDTLGVGVNVPIRTVLFTKLCKFDGRDTKVLSVREFKQISGRAGRRGFDDSGNVVAQAPEHVIENRILEQKAGSNPKKRKKVVFKKPPDKGYAHWDKDTFEKLIASKPEALHSQFDVDHGMVLQVLARGKSGCAALKSLIRSSHESPKRRSRLLFDAAKIFRSLVESEVLELSPSGIHVPEDLPSDFSLNRALSLFLLNALPVVEERAEATQLSEEEHALLTLSLVECTLENPDRILRKQLDALKTEKLRALKDQGMEYEQRMEELDKLEYPKPEADFFYEVFNNFRAHQPWLASGTVRPKSIVRDMYEGGHDFVNYIKEYGLARAEGVLLRYISDAYKALEHTIPDSYRSEALEDIIDYLRAIVVQVDSSLLDEWAKIGQSTSVGESRGVGESTSLGSSATAETEITQEASTTNRKDIEALLRAMLRRILRSLDRRRYTDVLACFGESTESEWDEASLAETMEGYWAEHDGLLLNATGTSNKLVSMEEMPDTWKVTQTLPDPAGNHDWFLRICVDLNRSQEENSVIAVLEDLGQL